MRAWRVAAAVALAVSILAVGTTPAQQPGVRPNYQFKPATKPTADKAKIDNAQIVKVVVAAMADGTRQFQNGQVAECYLTYYFTLSSVVWSLDEELQQRVVYRLLRAAPLPYDQAAVELRTALNDIRNRYDDKNRTLWHRLGGHDAVRSIVKTAYDRAAAKDSGVNLTRNGEFPYTTDRAQRMQKATVDLIKKLSDNPADKKEPVGVAAPKGLPVDEKLAARISDLSAQQGKLNAELATTEEEIKKAAADKDKLLPLREKRIELKERLAAVAAHLADSQELAKFKVEAGGLKAAPPAAAHTTYLDDLKKAHRSLRITYDEFSAAVQVFRESLEMHSIPEIEINELIDAVEKLRASIVSDYP